MSSAGGTEGVGPNDSSNKDGKPGEEQSSVGTPAGGAGETSRSSGSTGLGESQGYGSELQSPQQEAGLELGVE